MIYIEKILCNKIYGDMVSFDLLEHLETKTVISLEELDVSPIERLAETCEDNHIYYRVISPEEKQTNAIGQYYIFKDGIPKLDNLYCIDYLGMNEFLSTLIQRSKKYGMDKPIKKTLSKNVN